MTKKPSFFKNPLAFIKALSLEKRGLMMVSLYLFLFWALCMMALAYILQSFFDVPSFRGYGTLSAVFYYLGVVLRYWLLTIVLYIPILRFIVTAFDRIVKKRLFSLVIGVIFTYIMFAGNLESPIWFLDLFTQMDTYGLVYVTGSLSLALIPIFISWLVGYKLDHDATLVAHELDSLGKKEDD